MANLLRLQIEVLRQTFLISAIIARKFGRKFLPRRHRQRYTDKIGNFVFRKFRKIENDITPEMERPEFTAQVKLLVRKICSLAFQICRLCQEKNEKAEDLKKIWEQNIKALQTLCFI